MLGYLENFHQNIKWAFSAGDSKQSTDKVWKNVYPIINLLHFKGRGRDIKFSSQRMFYVFSRQCHNLLRKTNMTLTSFARAEEEFKMYVHKQ